MRTGSTTRVRSLTIAGATCAIAAALVFLPGQAGGAEQVKRVLVLYPTSDSPPGTLRFQESVRAAFAARPRLRVELHNEYLDVARFPDESYQLRLVEFLRAKYAGRTPDVIIAGLAPSLDFVLKHRGALFPGVPVVFGAIERREVAARTMGPGVVGIPMTMDLGPTLDLALRLQPDTRRVVVVAGSSRVDAYWLAEARREFRGYENRVEFEYVVGLPMDDLLRKLAALPSRTIVYYLHVLEDGLGNAYVPGDLVGPLCAAANAPVYGHLGPYLGRGIVGGRLLLFETEGTNAAGLTLRVLDGEPTDRMKLTARAENPTVVDWRQIRRWGIDEVRLPPGAVIADRAPSYWALYKWQIIGTIALCTAEALLIAGLMLERSSRRRAEERLRAGQRELRALTGQLIQAQETERRRIALELHDDLNQSLALLAVEMDLLGQNPPGSVAMLSDRLNGLSGRVKDLSSSVHGLSHVLHPSKLEQLGLVAAVRGLSHELAAHHGLCIEVADHEVPRAIPPDTALCLYRVTQEALQNVVKHSGAQHARVELFGGHDSVSLRVADDGTGFDPASVAGHGGLGLVGMRERLRIVGGDFRVDSRPSGGTRIEVRAPLTADDLPPDGSHR